MLLKNFYRVLYNGQVKNANGVDLAMIYFNNILQNYTRCYLAVSSNTQASTYDLYNPTNMVSNISAETFTGGSFTQGDDANGNHYFTQTVKWVNNTNSSKTVNSIAYVFHVPNYAYGDGTVYLACENLSEPITVLNGETLTVTFRFTIGNNG